VLAWLSVWSEVQTLTVSCFSKIQIGFTFLVPAHLGSPGQMAVKPVCVCFDTSAIVINYYAPASWGHFGIMRSVRPSVTSVCPMAQLSGL